jgi:hypothetical protein
MAIQRPGVETMGCVAGNIGKMAATQGREKMAATQGRDKAANVMINSLEQLSCRAQALAESFAVRLEPYIDTRPEETSSDQKDPCAPTYPRYFSQVSEYQTKINRSLDIFEEILSRLEI